MVFDSTTPQKSPCSHFICRMPKILKPEVRHGYCDVRSREMTEADMLNGLGKCKDCTSRSTVVDTCA